MLWDFKGYHLVFYKYQGCKMFFSFNINYSIILNKEKHLIDIEMK